MVDPTPELTRDQIPSTENSPPLEVLATLSQCLLQWEDGSGDSHALKMAGSEISSIATAAKRVGRVDVVELCELGERILRELANNQRQASAPVIEGLLEMCDTLAKLASCDEVESEQRVLEIASLAEMLQALSQETQTDQSPLPLSASASPRMWPAAGASLDPEQISQFKVESIEGLQMLEAVLLEFERVPHDASCVHAIFRVVHNIKGAADYVGLAQIKTLSHRLEDLLDLLRAGRCETTPALSDLVFRTVDELKAMIASLASDAEQDRDLTDLVTALVLANQTATLSPAPAFLAADSADDTAVYIDSAEQQLESIAACCKKLALGDASDAMFTTLQRAVTTLLAAAAYLKQPQLVESGCGLLQAVQVLRDGRSQTHERLAAACAERSADQPQMGERAIQETFPPATDVGPAIPNMQTQAMEPSVRSINAYCAELVRGDSSDAVLSGLRQSLTALGEAPQQMASAAFVEAASTLVRTVDAFGDTQRRSLAHLWRLSTSEIQHDNGSHEPPNTETASGFLQSRSSTVAAAPPTLSPAKIATAEREDRTNAAAVVAASKTMRVDQGKLDDYINLAGELVIARNALMHEFGQCRFDAPHHHRLKESVERVQRIVADIQANAMSMRMVPVQSVFQRFPRMVRDIAKAQGKQIEIKVVGEETELDKQVAEKLGDPLVHLIRNSADHGIESPDVRRAAGKSGSGLITLKAGREGSSIIIEIIDDGQGIDVKRLKAKAVEKRILRQDQADAMPREKALELIFAAGLSTAQVISDISGRGVGMDVVRSNIMELGGTVTVHSEEGKGSHLRLHLPLTLAVTTVVLVSSQDCLYAIPMESVRETVKVIPQNVKTLNGRHAISLRNQIVPIVSLADVLSSRDGRRGPGEETSLRLATDRSGRAPIVVVANGAEVYGISVDELRGQQEIVMKPLPSQLGQLPGIGGATITGDGSVVLILDPASLSSLIIANAPSEKKVSVKSRPRSNASTFGN